MILVIDNYDSFTYNLVQYLGELGAQIVVRRNDAISLDEVFLLAPERVVISPGPGRPNGAGISLPLIRACTGKIPVLGVCLGHQAIGEAFGGRVVRASRIMHGKSSNIAHDGKSIFHGVETPLCVGRYHSLIVERETLPDCLEISAQTDEGVIMGLRHRSANIEGVQFHPESVLTPEGKKILNNFLQQ